VCGGGAGDGVRVVIKLGQLTLIADGARGTSERHVGISSCLTARRSSSYCFLYSSSIWNSFATGVATGCCGAPASLPAGHRKSSSGDLG